MQNTLTTRQKELLKSFYARHPIRVAYDKVERKRIWDLAINRQEIPSLNEIKRRCPAFADRISNSYARGDNIQSAVFSECVYSQALADLFGLSDFIVADNPDFALPPEALDVIKKLSIAPRYIYFDNNHERLLVQAGGHASTDSVYVVVEENKAYTIEYKEPGAKTSEPDLPRYGEDGFLKITENFRKKYPQFNAMLDEKKDLNFFAIMGSNEHDFSAKSVDMAISENYATNKPADVICTEDGDGVLVMLPSLDIPRWAETEGEIRPAGRNAYGVWTPKALTRFLKEKGAKFTKDGVVVAKDKLGIRTERGGGGKISGYKITPIFFIRAADCLQRENDIIFSLAKVKQLKPTIAGKMYFRNLKYDDVKAYYSELI